MKGKLAPRYVGPYEIIKICGPVAYRVKLPPLKKCVRVPTEIVEQEDIRVEPDLSYVEYPIKVLDRKERVTRRKLVKMYKI